MKTKFKSLPILFLLIIFQQAYSQSTINGFGPGGHSPLALPALYYCGWDASGPANAIPFNIEHRGTNNINFLTGGTQRMTILGTASATPGFVGIGLSTPPLFRLDVQDNINITNSNVLGFGYFINGFDVLQIPGIENTYVGRGTGVNSTGVGSIQNTFIGFQAGGSNVGGDRNTFVGRGAGYTVVNGRFNTFIGADAGLLMSIGTANTFLGEHSGYAIVNGDNNTFVGSHCGQGGVNSIATDNTFIGEYCGYQVNGGNENTFSGMRAGSSCTNGSQNCFYGKWSGIQTNTGNANVAMGYLAGRFNHGGSNNTYVGTNAGVFGAAIYWNLTNVTALGWNATARADNAMILGNNAVKVGIGLSNDITPASGPTNKLEIDAGLNLTAAQPSGSAGASGLTFRDLHFGNTPSLANGVVLSVDANGEVILVPSGSGGGFASCGGPIPNLTANSAMDLNNFNLHFSSQLPNSRVGIGTSCAAPLFAKFTVNESSGTTFGSIGALILNSNVSPSTATTFGLVVTLNPTSPTFLDKGYTAGFFNTSGSKRCVAVEGRANGLASVGAANYGGYFVAQNGGLNYGIYAEAPAGAGQTSGGPPLGLNFAGYFNGDVVRVGTDNFTSDRTLKQNIDTISNALQIINLLIPETFYYDTVAHLNMALSTRKQWGFIAQDVETILPELVGSATQPEVTDSNGIVLIPALTYKTLNYQAFIAILMKGMQEQQNELANQNQRIDSLIIAMNNCCASNSRTQNPSLNQTDLTLTNSESIVLNQNVPNPFAEQTTITYNLPQSVQKAQLLFYDANGKLIKAVDLTERGKGQINVFANDLSNGIYSYALVVDGQIIDTKRMIKTQ
jgi:hypothetical protein